MKYIVLLCALLVAGCNHIPAKPEWPTAPNIGTCPDLTLAANSEKLSELLSTVTTNYGKYHECSARVQAWEEWYQEQKKIYQEAK